MNTCRAVQYFYLFIFVYLLVVIVLITVQQFLPSTLLLLTRVVTQVFAKQKMNSVNKRKFFKYKNGETQRIIYIII